MNILCKCKDVITNHLRHFEIMAIRNHNASNKNYDNINDFFYHDNDNLTINQKSSEV